MLISLEWIKDFVELPETSPKILGERFTLATAEVEEVKILGEAMGKIKIAEILSIEKHPEADNLNLVTFKTSSTEIKKVVCGASNVKIGLKTPYAPLGTLLPNGMLLDPKKIRGILSEGMLCSEEELGLKDHSEGILELPSDAPVGVDLKTFFKINSDIILNIDNKSLTHRPDLWGHYGVAREFATIFQKKLKNPFTPEWEKEKMSLMTKSLSPVRPKVLEGSSCLSYSLLSIDNISVGPSPLHLRTRLENVGLRSINNIVDISNYVMLELGIPLHIFDRQKITGDTLTIKRLNQDCSFKTLDGQERKLIATDTVIADQNGPLVLAGIMGGESSGVSEGTKNILIEVANWKASDVRKTTTRLGLRTDSSLRYEKTLDSSLCQRTLLRTLELIKEYFPQSVVVGKIETGNLELGKKPPLVLTTSQISIVSRLGKDISEDQIISILRSLDFLIEKVGQELKVTVPSFRATKDISQEEDLVEEIGRIVGYDNIVPESPAMKIYPAKLSEAQKIHRKTRDFLSLHSRAFEVFTYPLVGESLLKKMGWWGEQFSHGPILKNALSIDHDRMRSSLIPSLFESVLTNQKNFHEFRLFELGRVYPENKSADFFVKESTHLGLVSYSEGKENQFTEICAQLEKLLSSLNVPFEFLETNEKLKNTLIPQYWNGIHPYENLNIKIMGRIAGGVFSTHPLFLRHHKVRGNVVMGLIDLSLFENQVLKEKAKFTPLSKFPVSYFDCSVLAKQNQSVEEGLKALYAAKIKELKEVLVRDIFDLENGQKSVTLQCKFEDLDKTLGPDEIKNLEHKVISILDNANLKLKK